MKKRRFDDGGEVDALEEANKLEPIPMEPGPKAEPEKPKSFSQAFREARAAGDKTFMWQGKKYGTQLASGASSRSSAPAPAPAPAARSSAATPPRVSSSGIPVDPTAPRTGQDTTEYDTSGPSDLDRILMGLPVVGGIGVGIGALVKANKMRKAAQGAKEAAEVAKAAASKFASPQAKQATTETGRRFSPKAEMEAAESTMRGSVGRRGIQAKRAAAKEEASDIPAYFGRDYSNPSKSSSSTGRKTITEMIEEAAKAEPAKRAAAKDYSNPFRSGGSGKDILEMIKVTGMKKGGKVKGYAKGGSIDGCAQRGKTKGRYL